MVIFCILVILLYCVPLVFVYGYTHFLVIVSFYGKINQDNAYSFELINILKECYKEVGIETNVVPESLLLLLISVVPLLNIILMENLLSKDKLPNIKWYR